jgi:hypothetical protein
LAGKSLAARKPQRQAGSRRSNLGETGDSW